MSDTLLIIGGIILWLAVGMLLVLAEIFTTPILSDGTKQKFPILKILGEFTALAFVIIFIYFIVVNN